MQKYSILKGLSKAVIAIVLVGGPLLFDILPEVWLNLTLGGLLTLALNFLKVSYGK